MTGILKICFIGTVFSLLVALFGLADSVGGLMFPQGSDLADCTQKRAPVSPSRTETAGNVKRVGSR